MDCDQKISDLIRALTPFAEWAEEYDTDSEWIDEQSPVADTRPLQDMLAPANLTVGHLRRAREAVQRVKEASRIDVGKE